MATTGLGSQFGLKKAATWNTAVTVDKFYRYESETFALDQTYQDPVGLQAGITFAPQTLTKKTTRTASGGVQMMLPYKQTGHILDLMVAGTITPAQQGVTTAYLSTFPVGLSAPNKFATVQINKPLSTGDKAFTYPTCVLVSAAFSMATGGILAATFNFVASDETTPDTTPAGAALASAAYAASDDVWTHQDMTLTYGGSPAGAVKAIEWTWTQPYAVDRFYLDGSAVIAQPVPNGVATVTGTMTVEWAATTYYTAFRSGAFASLVATAAGPTAIASTYYPTFKNTFSAVQIRGTTPTVGGPDLLETSVPFVAKYDGTNAPWKVELTDTQATAW